MAARNRKKKQGCDEGGKTNSCHKYLIWFDFLQDQKFKNCQKDHRVNSAEIFMILAFVQPPCKCIVIAFMTFHSDKLFIF